MQNVYISINPFEKKMNILFSHQENDLSSVSIFPLPLSRGCFNGYCNYDEVFTSALTELLRVNNIPEANISLALPSRDICFDYVSLPNVGSARRNDDNYFTEIKTMYPEIKKPEDINTTLVKNDKNSVIYRYSLFGLENLEKIDEFFMTTNHSLDFITSDAIAETYLAMSLTGGKSLFSRDNTYEFVNLRKNYINISLVSDNQIIALNTIPIGTEALAGFSQKDLGDYRSFNKIDTAFRPFWHSYNAYKLHLSELGLPLAKKAYYIAPKGFGDIGEYMTAGSDCVWNALELGQYKPFSDNLGLISLYLGKVPKDFNFTRKGK